MAEPAYPSAMAVVDEHPAKRAVLAGCRMPIRRRNMTLRRAPEGWCALRSLEKGWHP